MAPDQYPKPVHVRAFGRNKIGKTEPGAYEGAGETGVRTSPVTLEMPVTDPFPEVDQILNIEEELVLVTAVERQGKKVVLRLRQMPRSTQTYADIKRGKLD